MKFLKKSFFSVTLIFSISFRYLEVEKSRASRVHNVMERAGVSYQTERVGYVQAYTIITDYKAITSETAGWENQMFRLIRRRK